MQNMSAEMTDAALDAEEIVEIEVAELEAREDLTLFSLCPWFGPSPSDRRLKVEVEDAGTLPGGLKLHSWRYLGGSRRFTGIMADELLADPAHAHAVHTDSDGLMRVDYAAIGYVPRDLRMMRIEGEAAVSQYRGQLD